MLPVENQGQKIARRMLPLPLFSIRLIVIIALLILPGSLKGQCDKPDARAAACPEANRIFHTDYRWKGSDGAYSIDLGDGRVLWLFGDAFIAYKEPYLRREDCVAFIRNCVAVETGCDPLTAAMEFVWRTKHGKPRSFFPEQDSIWFWPLDGAMVGDRLVIFLSKIHAVDTSLGFDGCGQAILRVESPGENPLDWIMENLTPPPLPLHTTYGSAVEIADSHMYVYSRDENYDILLARYTLDDAGQGSLDDPEWWCGDSLGWVRQSTYTANPRPLFSDGASEFSVWRDSASGCFLLIQARGFGQAQLVLRAAPNPAGPWSHPMMIYDPPENDIPQIMIYAGKAHPELAGDGVLLTYATNGPEESLLADSTIYYPRFVRLTLHPDTTGTELK